MTPVSSGLPSCSPDQRCTSTLGSPQTHHVATLPHSAPSQWVHPMGVTGLAVARLWVHLHLSVALGCRDYTCLGNHGPADFIFGFEEIS